VSLYLLKQTDPTVLLLMVANAAEDAAPANPAKFANPAKDAKDAKDAKYAKLAVTPTKTTLAATEEIAAPTIKLLI
jgi:hypothetical protein